MLTQAVIDQCTQDFGNISGFDRTELMHLEEGRTVGRAYPGSDSVNDVGTVHGGFLLALADQAAAAAGESLGRVTVTLNMSASFIRPGLATDAYLEITSHVVHAGWHTIVTEVEIANPQSKTVFKGMFTLMPVKIIE